MSANIRPAGVFDTRYDQDIALNRTLWDNIVAYGGFFLLLLIPLAAQAGLFGITDAWVGRIIRIAIFVISVQGLNILMGFTGQISLGHAAFMAVGAYSAAIFVRNLGMSAWLALPCAALFTGFVGLIFGLPSLRVKGFYLAMATLAAQFIIPWILRYPLEPYTNGSRPLPVPAPIIYLNQTHDETLSGSQPLSYAFSGGDLFFADAIRADVTSDGDLPNISIIRASDGRPIPAGELNLLRNEDGGIIGLEYLASKADTYTITVEPAEGTTATLNVRISRALSFASNTVIYYLVIPLTILLMLFARNIVRTRVGRAFISIRDNDLAAELLGINVFRYKLQAFFLSAVFAGIAGALSAFDTNSISLAGYQLDASITLLAMLVVGGAGFPLAPIFGVAFFRLVEEVVIPYAFRPFLETLLPAILPFIDPVNINSAINPTAFGIILTAFLIFLPRGFAYYWEILKISWKIRPFARM